MTAIGSGSSSITRANTHVDPFPENMQVSADAIRAWRRGGYHVSEQRKGSWLYLLARGNGESAVYKIVGPRLRGHAVVYEGFRVA